MADIEPKHPFASRAIWGGILTAVGWILPIFGIGVNADALAGVGAQLSSGINEIIGAIGVILFAFGIRDARRPLSGFFDKRTKTDGE